jgi:Domain of unknown function (DUF1844)
MAEEEKGFTIRDRRGAGAEPEGKAEAAPKPPEQPKQTERAQQAPGQPAPPVNFLSFVYSMGTSALMFLGESVGEGAAGQPPNLTHAQEIIDILTMLETKTKGNLTADEAALLEEMLYALRIKFVEKASAKKP